MPREARLFDETGGSPLEGHLLLRGVAHTLSCMYATRGVALRAGAGDVQPRQYTANRERSSR